MTDPASTDGKLSETLREIDPTRLNLDREFGPLLEIIERAQARVYRAVNRELVGMYWDIGAYVSAKVQAERWGKGVVAEFSTWVRRRLPGLKGFSPQNVWRMKQLFETYQGNPELSELVRETTWTNNLLIMAGAKTDEARQFYLLLATKHHYGSQELERQIDALLFERTMLSNKTTKQIVARHPELASLRALDWWRRWLAR